MDIIEIERIKDAYKKRGEKIPLFFYSSLKRANLYMLQRREWEIIRMFEREKIKNLVDMEVLDLGCGDGGELRRLQSYGARPEKLHGIDLLDGRVLRGRAISPNIDIRCGDASSLPYDNAVFDLVMQFTVFTSILDRCMKSKIAAEMLRVLKPGGFIIWYDFHVNNPGNHDVRGIGGKEIARLFPGCGVRLKRITLAPPLVRCLVRYSPLSCYLLEKIRLLNSHYLGTIRKETVSPLS